MVVGNRFSNQILQKESDDDNLQLEWRKEWAPDSIAKFGWDVESRSIHEEEFCNIFVGSLINWYNPSCEVILSIVLPSKVVLSLFYQFVDLALKSPMYVIQKGYFCAKILSVISKLSPKVSKSSGDGLGDL